MFPSANYIRELAEATRAIIGAREFCGNEANALRDWEADNRKLTATERDIVRRNANKEWARFQAEAGVTAPISAAERKEINRILR